MWSLFFIYYSINSNIHFLATCGATGSVALQVESCCTLTTSCVASCGNMLRNVDTSLMSCTIKGHSFVGERLGVSVVQDPSAACHVRGLSHRGCQVSCMNSKIVETETSMLCNILQQHFSTCSATLLCDKLQENVACITWS